MAKVFPFCGLRYNPAKAGDISRNIMPPYDQIKNDEQRKVYYDKSHYNFIRINYGYKEPELSSDNVYSRAHRTIKDWMDQLILMEDPTPAFYVYHQEFTSPTGERYVRKGFVGLIELKSFDEGGVKPHERTLSKPKEDRLNLLKNIDTHIGQVFQLFPDPENYVNAVFDPFTKQKPDLEAKLEDGQIHRMWIVSDPAAIEKVHNFLVDKQLFIADGHHRYETMVTFRDLRDAEFERHNSTQHHGNGMCTFVGMSDPGLVILPTHRAVHDLDNFNLPELLDKLGKYFDINPLNNDSVNEAIERLNDLGADGSNAFGLYAKGNLWYLLKLKDKNIMKELVPEMSDPWRQLDVAVLHTVIMDKILGITKEKQTLQTNIHYLRHAGEGVEDVENGEEQLLFVMNPTRLEQVREIANFGEVMPQKSTDFFPKLLDGLVSSQIKYGKKK